MVPTKNKIIRFYKYKNYLEIGVRNPADNFELIQVDNKIGVDPDPKFKTQ